MLLKEHGKQVKESMVQFKFCSHYSFIFAAVRYRKFSCLNWMITDDCELIQPGYSCSLKTKLGRFNLKLPTSYSSHFISI